MQPHPHIPELLSPAGTLKRMRYAFAYGADAVYAGQPRYSLRARNNTFTHENLVLGIQEAHAQNKKFFVASNLVAHNNKMKTYLRDLEEVIEAKPDALIMADPGLIMLVRNKWPDVVIHLSVQANAMNAATVKFWQTQGIPRVILSRELSLGEIQEIQEECPEMELEVFVHGALCMAHSGRCLLSGYLNHRDPNQGACTNSCRWQYKLHEANEDEWGNFVLEETQRPGAYMPIFEDENGTYIFNSKDLRAIQHVDALHKMGIHCFKIEGRTKSHYYAARVTQLYRQAIDDAVTGKPFNKNLMDELEGLSTRGYTEGFYRRHPPEDYQSYENRKPGGIQQQFVGEIMDHNRETQMIDIEVKNQFNVGDTLEIMTPTGNSTMQLTHMENLKGAAMQRAPGNGHQVRIPIETATPCLNDSNNGNGTDDLRYGLIIRHF